MWALRRWASLRPSFHYVLSSTRLPSGAKNLLWSWYWHVWLSLRYWSYWPTANPRLTRGMVRAALVAAVYLAHRRLS